MTNTKREIKFRAWDKQLNIITDVVCLNLGTWNDVILVHPDSKIVLRQETYNQKKENIELMQFTGLLDKNGKEIYFGDILQTSNSDDSDGLDLWKPEDFGYTVVVENPDELGVDFTGWVVGEDESVYSTLFVEIIGNIYENPELIRTNYDS